MKPPVTQDDFTSPLHDERTASWLGLALGISFGVCFLTGLLSHLIQEPPSWFVWPSRPAGLYRITQGLHIATGIAAIPLLLAKLWVVYPHLWTWPPITSIAHAIERVALVPLVGGSIFLLMSGLNNIAGWYPWPFFFPRAHFWAAWITIGGLIVHIGAKASVFGLIGGAEHAPPNPPRGLRTRPVGHSDSLSRRGFLGTVAAAVAGVTVATVGQTVGPLRRLAVLAPRDPGIGPQGFPVNKSAQSARVKESAVDPAYRLRIDGNVATSLEFTLDELRAMPATTATLPIACVEGWSAVATWTGVPVRDLLARAGAPDDSTVRVESLQRRGRYRASELNPSHAGDHETLLAYEVNGEPLHIDHGFPVRLIGPNRPGVMQTKWVAKLTVA